MTDTRNETLERLWLEVEQLVEKSHLFRCLDETGRRSLLERGRIFSYPAGSVIIEEGSVGDDFFVIDNGVVEVSTKSHTDEVSLTTLQRGAFFGEGSVLTGAPRTATVTALTDATVLRFLKNDVDELLASNPKAKRLLDAVIAGRARDTAEKVARASTMPPKSDD